MQVELEQLDRDAMLLMYLANELSPADHAAVEQRLSADPSLAAELQRLRGAEEVFANSLMSADAQTQLPMSCETAVRRVSRAMKQWQVDRLTKPPAGTRTRLHFHLPWWGYASGVAAAIIVGVLVWSSNIPDAGIPAPTAEEIQKQQEQLAETLQSEWSEGFSQEIEYARHQRQQTLLASMDNSDDINSEVFLRDGAER